jgi:uncharacterized protein YkwD
LGKETAFTKASDAIYPAYVRPRLPLALGIAFLAAFAVFFALRGAMNEASPRATAAPGSVDPLGAVWIMGVPRPPAPEMTLAQALDVIGAVQKIAAFAAPPKAEPAAVAQPAVRAQAPAVQPPPAAWLDRDFAAGVLADINAQRRAVGLAPLASDGALARAAEGYAQTMARYNWFSHTGPDGSSFAGRIRAAGFTANVALGEALASGDGSWAPANFVQLWMGSAAHRELLLGAYARAGVGCHFQREGGGVIVRCVLDVAG